MRSEEGVLHLYSVALTVPRTIARAECAREICVGMICVVINGTPRRGMVSSPVIEVGPTGRNNLDVTGVFASGSERSFSKRLLLDRESVMPIWKRTPRLHAAICINSAAKQKIPADTLEPPKYASDRSEGKVLISSSDTVNNIRVKVMLKGEYCALIRVSPDLTTAGIVQTGVEERGTRSQGRCIRHDTLTVRRHSWPAMI